MTNVNPFEPSVADADPPDSEQPAATIDNVAAKYKKRAATIDTVVSKVVFLPTYLLLFWTVPRPTEPSNVLFFLLALATVAVSFALGYAAKKLYLAGK